MNRSTNEPINGSTDQPKMTHLRNRNREYHNRIARAVKALKRNTFYTFFFVEHIPPKPETEPPPPERWVLDIIAVRSTQDPTQRPAYHGVWRSTADPKDRGRVPGSPCHAIVVSWDESNPEENVPPPSPNPGRLSHTR
jgi:hypothetical protein